MRETPPGTYNSNGCQIPQKNNYWKERHSVHSPKVPGSSRYQRLRLALPGDFSLHLTSNNGSLSVFSFFQICDIIIHINLR